jgi:hypothetical protein
MKSASLPLRKARVVWPRLHRLKSNPGRILTCPAAMLIQDGVSPRGPTFDFGSRTRGDRHLVTNQGVGMNGRPAPRDSTVIRKPEIAYGARALWRRSPRSSPRAGKPSTWPRGAVSPMAGLNGGTRDA